MSQESLMYFVAWRHGNQYEMVPIVHDKRLDTVYTAATDAALMAKARMITKANGYEFEREHIDIRIDIKASVTAAGNEEIVRTLRTHTIFRKQALSAKEKEQIRVYVKHAEKKGELTADEQKTLRAFLAKGKGR